MEKINLNAKYSHEYKVFPEDQSNYTLSEISKIIIYSYYKIILTKK